MQFFNCENLKQISFETRKLSNYNWVIVTRVSMYKNIVCRYFR